MLHETSSKVNFSSSGAALGNNTNTASAFLSQPPVVRKYYLQSLAREILPTERVAKCHRFRAPNHVSIRVLKNDDTGRSHYSGLLVCGSLWHCPVCGARISEGRRQELAASLAHAEIRLDDGSVIPLSFALGTFTASHKITVPLLTFYTALSAAYRRFTSGRWYQDLKEEYGVVGSVRSCEVMWGRNGWHFHIHTLFFFAAQHSAAALQGLQKAFKLRWREVLSKEGLTASWERGVDLKTAKSDVAEYVAKFGHEPKDAGWGITHELTKSGSKKSGGEAGKSMLELLFEYGDGDVRSGRRWKEYAICFKGRNQLVWSRGLRALLGIGDEKSDDELSQIDDSKSDRVLASLSPDQWRAVLRADVRGELLVKANTASDEDFNLWLADLLARWMPVDEGVKVSLVVGVDGAYQIV